MEEEYIIEKIGKKKFSGDEDEMLAALVNKFGEKDWKTIAFYMRGRSSRQCRERWKYYLNSTKGTNKWAKEEDQLLLSKYDEYGTHWAEISKFFPDKNGINIKNRFHKLQRKMKKKMLIEKFDRDIETSSSENDIKAETRRCIVEFPLPLSRLPITFN